MACPIDYAFVLMGERFGRLPWEIEEAPNAQLAKYINILGIEGEIKGLLAGAEPGEEIFLEGWDDDE